MEITNFLKLLHRQRYILIVVPVIAIVITFFLTRNLPNEYTSKAQVATGLVDQSAQILNSRIIDQESRIIQEFQNLIQIMQSKRIMDQISYELILHDLTSNQPYKSPSKKVKELNASARAHAIDVFRQKLLSKAPLSLFVADEKGLSEVIESMGYDMEELSKNLRIYRLNSSDFIQVEFNCQDPLMSAFVVNKLCTEFIDYYTKLVNENQLKAVSFLDSVMLKKYRDLDTQITGLKSYKIQNRVLNLEEQAKQLYAQLGEYETKRQEAEQEIIAKKGAIQQIDAKFNPNDRKQVMIATDLGVWSTSDITAVNPGWEPTNQNLANVRCDMLKVRSSDKLVAVATHGRGVFTTQAFQAVGVPAADFSVNKKVAYLNTNIVFSNNSTGANAWSWNFGANATPATANTIGTHSVQYNVAGKKSPSLTINNMANTLITKNDLITILPNRGLSYNLTNGGNFETNPDDFADENTSTACKFVRGNSSIAGKDGTTSGSFAWVLNPNDAVYPDMSEAKLYTPNFNFVSPTTYTLSFKTKFRFEANYDGFIVEYSTNKGTTWTQLGNALSANWYNGTKLNSGGFVTDTRFFTGSTNGFETKTFDVSFLSGNTDVAFRFVFKSDENTADAGVAIDDFTIIGSNLPTQLLTLSPPNSSIDVLRNTNLVMTFDKNMQKGTGNITIKKVTDNSIVQTINVTSTNVTIASNVVTITQNGLDYITQYYVEVQNGALKDINNNNYAGFSGNTTWKFTTIANIPNQLLTLSPPHLSTNVAINTDLVMTFSKNMQKGTGNITIKKSSDNSVTQTIDVNTTNVSINNNIVTMTGITLNYSTNYYVEVGNIALKDIDNVVYAGFSGNTTWSFTTQALVAPPVPSFVGNIGDLDVIYNTNYKDFAVKTNGKIFTNANIKIFDLRGTLVNNQNLNELVDNTSLNMKNYTAEGYIVVIETAQGGKTKKVYKVNN
ncbi:MAG: hypothetical protein EAZ20_00910 [Bacteroidetes bacterium]|nr:MAG: hypothetical protein EAZ20_00910 [Bacteroidota bacterium]